MVWKSDHGALVIIKCMSGRHTYKWPASDCGSRRQTFPIFLSRSLQLFANTQQTHTHTHIIRKRCVQLSPTHFLIRNIIIFSIFTTSIVLHYEKFLSQYFLSIEKLMDFIWSTATTEKWCVMCYIFSFHLSAIFCVLSDKLLHTISWRRLWHLNCKWSWQS